MKRKNYFWFMDDSHNSDRIEELLLTHLRKNGSAVIPDVGRFSLVRHSARVDLANKVVHAPYYDLEFSTHTEQVDAGFLLYIQKEKALSDQAAFEYVSSFIDHVNDQLEIMGQYDIEHIGRLVNSSDGLEFTPDTKIWGPDVMKPLAVAFEPVPYLKTYHEQHPEAVMADLDVDEFIDELEAEMQTDPLEETKEEIAPPLVTQEPERTVEVEQEKEERYEEEQEEAVLAVVPELGEEEPPLEKIEIEEEEVKKKKRPLMWLPLIASLVILLAVVFLWRSFEEMAYRNEVEGELSTNIPKDRLNQSPETNMSMVLPTDSNAGLDSGNIREGNSGVTNESEIASNIQNEADVEAETEEINSEEDGNTGIVEGEEISEDPVNEESTRVYGVKPQVQENNQCVIIVGAFKRMTNAHRMNDNLQKAGYQVYIDSSRNLTRVGFYSDCARSELRNRLDQARSEIESGAWILD